MRPAKIALSAVLLLLTAACLHGAPRPGKKEAPPRAVTPGKYKMIWNGCEWDIVITGDGVYKAGNVWEGGWSFSEKDRVFAVSETCNEGASYLIWWAALGKDLKGEGKFDTGGKVTLELIPQP